MSDLVFDATDSPRVSTTQRVHPNVRLALSVLLVCAGYYIGALIGKSLRFPSSHLALIWPPTAVLLAGLLLARRRTWWIYLLAAAPVHILVQAQDAVPVWGIMSLLIGNFGQALMAAFSVRYFNKEAPLFSNFRAVVVFMVGAVILTPVAVSSIAAYLYVLSGWEQNYWYAWRARVLSNALSTLMIVPPIILLATRGATAKTAFATPQRYIEAGLLLVAFVLTGWISFGKAGEALFGMACPIIMPLPVLLWSAVRFGPEGLCLSILLVAYYAFIQATGGHGFFAMDSPAQNVLSLQLYLIMTALPLMLLAVLIEERREKEDALREGEERYRTLAETATDVIMTLDLNSTILFANPAVVNVFGYTPREVVGQKITMLMPESRRQRHEEGMRRYLQTGRKSLSWNSVSFPGLHKDGREIMLDISFTESQIGDTRLFTGIMRDVTERKRVESRQNTQYAITRILAGADSIAAAAPQLIQSICECLDWEFGEIWRVDHETNLLTCCETWHPPSKDLAEFAAASRHFTFSSGAGLPGRVWTSGKPAWISDLAVDRDFLRTSLTTKAGLNSAFAFPIVLGDETLGIMVFFSHENREPDEDLLQMMASIGSQMGQFAERKRAEAALRESEARLQLGMEAARFGYWEVEVDSGKTTRSPSLERLLGVTPGSTGTLREAFIALIHPEDREIPVRHVERCIETFECIDIEYRIIRPDGTIRWMASRGQAVLGPDGRVSRVVGMSADITERKRAEEELKKALAEVQRLKERLELENVYLRSEVLGAHRYGEIIGESEGIRKVLEEVERVGGTDMTVLVLGETGTGKELVARLVYEKSGRRERPLVKVNCSALPAELIESELFGHERGAFTGAVAKQVGRFELADGGTIFLDEVGELPLRLQPKLLTVLQEGEFERLGSGKTIKVDVRVIAATNRNLIEAVQRGRFRSDLYYRLNVYPIEIPPLREHREDIELLAEVFLQEAGRRLGKSFGKIPGEVIEALRGYTWPGNVRELENVIGRAAVTSTGVTLQLPDGWNQASGQGWGIHPSTTVPEPFMFHKENTQSLLTLEQFERTRILEVLHQTNWRIEGPKGAALILGLHPNTLRSRMNKLEIRRSAEPRNLVVETTK